MDDLITVIVPVYNTYKTLKRTIESIVEQDYKQLEIIIIDDGSENITAELCDEIGKSDSRIIVIHKSNEGLGLTRNFGINIAKGKYILFIDSDDYIEKNMILDMVHIGAKENEDIVCTDLFYNDLAKNTQIESRKYQEDILDYLFPRAFGKRTYKYDDSYNVSACTKMYKVEFLRDNGLLFKSEREYIWEDLAFNCECLLLAQKVYVINQAYYHYCYNEDSITHKYDSTKFERTMQMYNYLLTLIESCNNKSEAYERLCFMVLGNIRMIIKQIVNEKSAGKTYIMNELRSICSDKRVVNIINGIDKSNMSLTQNTFSLILKSKNCFLVYLLAKLQLLSDKGIIN